MPRPDLIQRAREFVEARCGDDGSCAATPIEGLQVVCSRAPSDLEATLYAPSVCLILQGQKETVLAHRQLRLAAGDSVVVSHHLPIRARIVEASVRDPYLALVLDLDLSVVRSLYEEVGETEIEDARARSLEVGESGEPLVDAMDRLFSLVDRPHEAKVLAPLVRREIHYRLLLARQGGMLRQLLFQRSHASRVARAIARIRQELARAVSVEDLARTAGMSSSSFHQHFKEVTGTTPLQYQKDLRLLAARQRLLDGTHSVSETAYDVGYESAAQFSREYSRKFGYSPRHDLQR